jgi:hypothetical protein
MFGRRHQSRLLGSVERLSFSYKCLRAFGASILTSILLFSRTQVVSKRMQGGPADSQQQEEEGQQLQMEAPYSTVPTSTSTTPSLAAASEQPRTPKQEAAYQQMMQSAATTATATASGSATVDPKRLQEQADRAEELRLWNEQQAKEAKEAEVCVMKA